MTDSNFDWSQVQQSMEDVEILQAVLYEKMWDAAQSTDPEVRTDYYHTYYALLEKQHILFTRLKLMKLEELSGIELAIEEYCTALGKDDNEHILDFHIRMKAEVKEDIFHLTGENLDDFDGIDIELL